MPDFSVRGHIQGVTSKGIRNISLSKKSYLKSWVEHWIEHLLISVDGSKQVSQIRYMNEKVTFYSMSASAANFYLSQLGMLTLLARKGRILENASLDLLVNKIKAQDSFSTEIQTVSTYDKNVVEPVKIKRKLISNKPANVQTIEFAGLQYHQHSMLLLLGFILPMSHYCKFESR